MEVVASGLGFAEGPVAGVAGEVVLVSVDLGLVFRVRDGRTSVAARPGGGPNGAAEAADGTLYLAQSGRRLEGLSSTPTDAGGGIDVVSPEGDVDHLRPGMESPNDLCFGPDGSLYATDPSRPLGSRRGRIWRYDVGSGRCDLLAETDWYPNGIAFDADDRLHVANTDDATVVRTQLDGPRLGEMEVVAHLPRGRPDGIAFDADGNLVVAVVVLDQSGPGEIQVFSPHGDLLEAVEVRAGSLCTNLCIDAAGVLYATVADAGCLVRRTWPSRGLVLHPFRGPVPAGAS